MFCPLLSLSLTALAVVADPSTSLHKTRVIGAFSPSLGHSVELFAGLPYARPPLGKHRFLPSKLQLELPGSKFNASSYGPGCLQLADIIPTSEDCLTLNVLRPAGTKKGSKLPVVLWIHGALGDFVSGASSIYDGSGLVARSVERGTPVIFIGINYRLGPLGFPQGQEGINQDALNLGLRDQLVAFEWVKKNIGAFGGDSRKLTVVGESAGAHSIDIHIFGPWLRQYARGVIIQSSYRDPQYGPLHSTSSWRAFVSGVPQCAHLANTTSTFECLQAVKESSTIRAAWGQASSFLFQPDIDGPGGLMVDLPSQITPLSPLPVIIGSTLDEGTLFVPQTTNSTKQIRDWIINGATPSPRGPKALAAAADRVLELYPDIPAINSPFGTGNETFGLSSQYKRSAAVLADMIFEWHRRAFTRYMSRNTKVPVYGYKFSDPDASLGDTGAAPRSLGVPHASEIAYVFGVDLGLLPPPPTPTAKALSLQMMDYWLSFVDSLDPNDGKGTLRPHWGRYAPSSGKIMQLNGKDLKMIPDTYRKDQIAFFDEDPIVFHR